MVLLIELKNSYIRNWMFYFIGFITLACTEEYTNWIVTSDGVLQIKVATNRIETKGAIFDSYLPNKSNVSIWVTDSNGESYDPLLNETFELYTANGDGAEQTWSAHSPIPLDSRTATVYAFYPNGESGGLIKVTNDQTDYMYATPTTVSKTKPLASLVMNHALSIIELSCVKNNAFSGAGSITALRISGSAVSGGGILDVKTGKLSDLSSRATIELPVSGMTLSEAPSVGHVIVIPRGVSGELTLSVKVDNVWYSVKANPISLQQGKKYHYDLSIGREYAQVGEVQVTDWVDNHVGDETIEYGNFKINISGDRENIAFNYTNRDNGVTIKCIGINGYGYPYKVGMLGSASLTQDVEGFVRTLYLTNLSSDVTLTFNGVYSPRKYPEDGVYILLNDGVLIDPLFYNDNGRAVIVVNNSKGQKLMIANHEDSGLSYKTASEGKKSTSAFYWGGYNSDQSITNYSTSKSAENDFLGKENSNVLKSVTTGGGSYTEYATVGQVLNEFIKSKYADENLGFADWIIPSSGQARIITDNISEINSALSLIGASQISGWAYWHSSEYSSEKAWGNIRGSSANADYKYNVHNLRLVRIFEQ